MTIEKRIIEYLSNVPQARERSLHKRGMVNLLLQDYPMLKEIPKETLIAFCSDFENYNRIWRQVLQDAPSLRGKDWGDRAILEGDYMAKLGYDVNHTLK